MISRGSPPAALQPGKNLQSDPIALVSKVRRGFAGTAPSFSSWLRTAGSGKPNPDRAP